VLASSREPLGVEGEAIFAVPSMALPASIATHDAHGAAPAEQLEQVGRSEAVRLFVDRAVSILPSFSLDPANMNAVVEICRRLDGIPLALELAAARVNVLSVEEIAQGLGDRFQLLTGGRRTAAPRQQTLQAAIDWSWDLLAEPDRRLLRRLSVFAGGWTLDAAAAVTYPVAPDGGEASSSSGDRVARFETLDGLSRLVDRSLVVVDHEGSTRYRMLETIRQYAGDKLVASGEAVELRDRHLVFFRQLALDAESRLEGPEMAAWLVRSDAEVDNLRAATERALETRPEVALELCVAMSPYWMTRSVVAEGLERTMEAVDLVRRLSELESASARRARSVLVARALARATWAALSGGRSAAALGEEAVAAARETGDPAAIGDALLSLAMAKVYTGGGSDAGASRDSAEEALRIATDLGGLTRLSRVQTSLAMIESALGSAAAEDWAEQATQSARRSGNSYAIASAAQVRGRVASRAGRLPEAQRWFSESQAQFHAIGDRRFELSAQSELAHALRRAGQIERAEAEYHQTIEGWQHTGNRGAVANQLESLGFVALTRGNGVRAARLLGAAEALRDIALAPMTSFEREEYEAEVRRLHGELDEGSLASAWADGRQMTADEAVVFAISN
jgi:predicted ATPase